MDPDGSGTPPPAPQSWPPPPPGTPQPGPPPAAPQPGPPPGAPQSPAPPPPGPGFGTPPPGTPQPAPFAPPPGTPQPAPFPPQPQAGYPPQGGFAGPPPGGAPPPYGASGGPPPGQWGGAPVGPPKTDGFAIAALVTAIFGGLLFSFIFSLIGRGRIKASRGAKKGMGLVVASWIICAIWIVIFGAIVALVASGVLDHENVDDYPDPPERDIALVVDQFEEADGARTCDELITPQLRATFELAPGGCEAAVTVDGPVADIDITSISIDGDVATVEVEENDDLLVLTLVNDGTSWRIDDIGDR